jgi:hypothetical protein
MVGMRELWLPRHSVLSWFTRRAVDHTGEFHKLVDGKAARLGHESRVDFLRQVLRQILQM